MLILRLMYFVIRVRILRKCNEIEKNREFWVLFEIGFKIEKKGINI